MVANGQLKTPKTTIKLPFEVRDILFEECFIVLTNLTSQLSGLLYLQRNSIILDMRQGVTVSSLFSMQFKHAYNTYYNVNGVLLIRTDILIQSAKNNLNHVKVQVYTEIEVTAKIQPCLDLESTDDLMICPALTTTQKAIFSTHQ